MIVLVFCGTEQLALMTFKLLKLTLMVVRGHQHCKRKSCVSTISNKSISNVTSCVNQSISSLFVPGSNINWYVDTLGSSAIFNGIHITLVKQRLTSMYIM